MKSKILTFFVVSLSALMILSGCDSIRSMFGMPTSKEIKEKKALMAQAEALKAKRVADSLALEAAKADSIRLASEKPKVEPDYKYYVTVGALRKSFNVKRMVARYESRSYKVTVLPQGNGLNIVSVGGSNSFSEAVRLLREVKKYEPEVWIFKNKAGR